RICAGPSTIAILMSACTLSFKPRPTTTPTRPIPGTSNSSPKTRPTGKRCAFSIRLRNEYEPASRERQRPEQKALRSLTLSSQTTRRRHVEALLPACRQFGAPDNPGAGVLDIRPGGSQGPPALLERRPPEERHSRIRPHHHRQIESEIRTDPRAHRHLRPGRYPVGRAPHVHPGDFNDRPGGRAGPKAS